MILQARKKGGDINQSRNLIDTRIVWEDYEGKTVDSCVHSIEVVEGVETTHGGGAQAGEWLHYKNSETDVDGDGIIDYTETQVHTTLTGHGKSSIRVVAKVIFVEDMLANQEAWAEWNQLFSAEDKRLRELHGPDVASYELGSAEWQLANPMPAEINHELKSGVISLEWEEDIDSNWS